MDGVVSKHFKLQLAPVALASCTGLSSAFEALGMRVGHDVKTVSLPLSRRLPECVRAVCQFLVSCVLSCTQLAAVT